MYGKRKDHLVKTLSAEWSKLDNRVRFILMVISRELVISNRKKAELLEELKSQGFAQFPKEKKQVLISSSSWHHRHMPSPYET